MDCVALVSVRVIVCVSRSLCSTLPGRRSLVDIKMLTVNETFGSETETRQRPSQISPRPRRDRDVETESTSLMNALFKGNEAPS